jgi:hypothetical protein
MVIVARVAADRAGQRQPAREPLSGAPGDGPRSLPGSNRLHGRKPSRPQGGHQGSQRGQCQHPGWRCEIDPDRDGHADPENRALLDLRQHPQAAEHRPGQRPGQHRNPELGQIGGGDLGWGEPDALEHTDPAVAGQHRARRYGGDNHGREQQGHDGVRNDR